MIDPNTFNNLEEQQKALIVMKHSKHLSSMDYGKHRIQLYSCGSQFIELWFNPKQGTIDAIRIPTSEQLEKHLNDIDLCM